jgi:hypothetical protein
MTGQFVGTKEAGPAMEIMTISFSPVTPEDEKRWRKTFSDLVDKF